MSDIVLVERRGRSMHITLNRPEKRNAINDELIGQISAGIGKAIDDPEIRVIVLTGQGDKAFCAGGDLQPGGGFNFDFSQPRTPYGDLLRQVQDCPLPIIAAINGHCLAGGMGLLAMADLAIAVETAKFGLPEVKIGIFPMQVMSLLQRLVPPRLVREWALTGEVFTARAALAAGLLNDVVPADELDAKVKSLIDTLAARSPTAIRRGKYALKAMQSMTVEQAISFAEGQIGLAAQTGDAREGFASFNEKREARFKGD